MTVLELCLSPDFGGLELYMRDLSLWLSRQPGITLYLGLRRNSRLFRDLADLETAKLLFRSPLRWFPFPQVLVLARFIETHRIDVVHVHWKDDLFLTAFAKKICSRQFIFIHTRQMMVPGKKVDPYHRFVYRKLDRFIAITRQIEQQALKNLGLPREKVVQIYYGVRPAPVLSADEVKKAKARYGIRSGFTAGVIGRIDWYKAQYLFIEALAALNRQGTRVNGVIAGHAMEKGYLEVLRRKVVEAGIGDQIIFLDFTPDPHELMQCFDVLVLTTHVETFGLVLVEAMSLGIPVIGSNAGGVLEIIEHEKTGLLFETKNAVSLAGAIKRLADDPDLRKRLAREGRRKAEKEYDTETQHNKILELMFTMTDKKNQASG